MTGSLRNLPGYGRKRLTAGWQIACAPSGSDLACADGLAWRPIEALGTVAAALRARGEWSLDEAARRFDAEDWWYRLRFDAPAHDTDTHWCLDFDGLATVARVWLNGTHLFDSDNMFVSHEVDVGNLLPRDNDLLLQFKSLDGLLAARRPRPRWRTPMVENQQLRWFRTTLLGRTPGWSPPAAPVGPWRPVWIQSQPQVRVSELKLRTHVRGGAGVVTVEARVDGLQNTGKERVELVVSRGGSRHSIALERRGDGSRCAGRLEIPDVALWWPHTHGEPALHEARLLVEPLQGGDSAFEVQLGRIGFRTLRIDTSHGNFAVCVNDVPVFCRGACWTPLDCVSLHSEGPQVDDAIAQVRAAGMNMLRVGGTMVYESDGFLDACDANGILLWQDFMFANMEYPLDDAAFEASVRREVAQVLERFGGRPCLTVLCGNSEGEQQAAMWGAPRERWNQPLFHTQLPSLVDASGLDVPYWPSSAHGGSFPHQSNAGTASYYGVGAYCRPLEDARRSEVRFASECLAFANVPEEDTLRAMASGTTLHVHHPQWKARVPRDLGAGWDFDDIRDHYLATLFRVQPLELRYGNSGRYLDLSRIVSGEVMAAAFREWRRSRSRCNGALVWFLTDFWPGAGWGIVDSAGRPKAPWFYLRRMLQSRAIFMTDESVNGVFVHIINESAEAVRVTVEISLYRSGGARVSQTSRSLDLPGRATLELPACDFVEGFSDLNHAFRFGPPSHDLIVARLFEDAADRPGERHLMCEDFFFPAGYTLVQEDDIGLTATAHAQEDGDVLLTLRTRACARSVVIRMDGFSAEDQYFHLAPGSERVLRLRRLKAGAVPKGIVQAMNARAPARIELVT